MTDNAKSLRLSIEFALAMYKRLSTDNKTRNVMKRYA